MSSLPTNAISPRPTLNTLPTELQDQTIHHVVVDETCILGFHQARVKGGEPKINTGWQCPEHSPWVDWAPRFLRQTMDRLMITKRLYIAGYKRFFKGYVFDLTHAAPGLRGISHHVRDLLTNVELRIILDPFPKDPDLIPVIELMRDHLVNIKYLKVLFATSYIQGFVIPWVPVSQGFLSERVRDMPVFAALSYYRYLEGLEISMDVWHIDYFELADAYEVEAPDWMKMELEREWGAELNVYGEWW